MIPLLLRKVATVAAAASSVGFIFASMDCNPDLFLYHWIFQRRNNQAFAGQCVWIVGASSGIGEELAYRLSSSAARLILSSRSEAKLQTVARRCQLKHPQCAIEILPLDVSQSTQSGSDDYYWQEKLQKLPSFPDIIVLNAGKGHLSPVTETKVSVMNDMMQTNALWIMTFLPAFLQYRSRYFEQNNHHHQASQASKLPHLVVTSSVAGILPVPLSASYAASKHAVMGYLRSFQAECPDQIRIDIICPGPIDTNFHVNSAAERKTNKGHMIDRAGATKPSPLKMPIERCVDLMMTAMDRPSRTGREVWIAQQPTLMALYLQQFMPGLLSWSLRRVVGPKRVQLWQEGLDLYDPESWKRISSRSNPNAAKKDGKQPKP